MPHGQKLLYDGHEVDLSPEEEEVRSSSLESGALLPWSTHTIAVCSARVFCLFDTTDGARVRSPGRYSVRGDEGHGLCCEAGVRGELFQVLPPGAEGAEQGDHHRVQQVRLHKHLQLECCRAREEEGAHHRGASSQGFLAASRRHGAHWLVLLQDKKKIKADRDAAEKPYTTCTMDGRVEKARALCAACQR